jgi:hypothetical protein
LSVFYQKEPGGFCNALREGTFNELREFIESHS